MEISSSYGILLIVILILNYFELDTMPSIVVDSSQIPDSFHGIWLNIVRCINCFRDDRNFLIDFLFWNFDITFPKSPSPCTIQRLIRSLFERGICPGFTSINTNVDSNDS